MKFNNKFPSKEIQIIMIILRDDVLNPFKCTFFDPNKNHNLNYCININIKISKSYNGAKLIKWYSLIQKIICCTLKV